MRWVVVALVLIGVVAGAVLYFWPAGAPAPPDASTAQPTLGQLTPCTGLDDKGDPVGASATFDEAAVRSVGIMLHVRYSDAQPGKSSFQIRWNSGKQQLMSPLSRFENSSGYVAMNLGKGLAAGSYQADFLVDGQVRQTTTFAVVTGPRAARRDAKEPGGPRVARNDDASERVAQPAPAAQPSALPTAPHQPGSPQPSKPGWSVEVAPQTLHYQAKHWHRIGRCIGQLTLTPRAIEFSSPEHGFAYDIKQVRLHQDGIEDSEGKAWRFALPDADITAVLSRWKRGELFPDLGAAEQEAPPADPAGRQKRSFAARHKHRFGSCSGELILTPEGIEFQSVQHSFKCEIGQVRVDNEGVHDCTGKSWNFDVSGEDIGVLLYLWKAGRLFPQ